MCIRDRSVSLPESPEPPHPTKDVAAIATQSIAASSFFFIMRFLLLRFVCDVPIISDNGNNWNVLNLTEKVTIFKVVRNGE